MKKYGVFDVIGPIMIGPSSSHTAGAARLGKIARVIASEEIKEVIFELHGSFAKTYKGHGTDRALVAGILGMEPCDNRLRDALEIAKEIGLKVRFVEVTENEDVHPNTVRFHIKGVSGKEYTITGSSIGGGSIIVTEVNGNEVQFTGEYPTIIISNTDVPGIVSKVTALLYEEGINIGFMKLYRRGKGKAATMIFEVDSILTDEIVEKIKEIQDIHKVVRINPVRE